MLKLPDWFVGIAAGIVLTCYVFAVAFRYLPSPLELFGDVGIECQQAAFQEQQKTEANQKQSKQNRAFNNAPNTDPQEKQARYDKNINDCLIARYTGSQVTLARWLVIATFLLATFGFCQVLISRNTARRQLRAYLWVKAVELHDLEAGKLPYVILEVRNAGQTPAYDAVINAGCIIYPEPFPPNTPFPTIGPEGVPSRLVLHPGTEPPFKTRAPLRAAQMMPQSVADDLKRGDEHRLFIFALVEYRDAFGTKQKTYFCNGVDASAAIGATGPYEVDFVHTNQHNTAT